MKTLILFSANHTSIKQLLLDENTAAGSQAPAYTISLLPKLFDESIIFVQGSVSKDKVGKLQIENCKIITTPNNRIISMLFQLIIGTTYSIKKINNEKYYYGMGYHSLISYVLSKVFKSISIARFYGTFLGQHCENGKIRKKEMSFKRLIEHLCFKINHTHIICTNDGTFSLCLSEVLRQDNLHLMFNGLNRPNALLEEMEMETGSNITFISVSRFAKWKRIDLAIIFFSKVIEIEKYHNAKLIIVGFGEGEESYKNLVSRLNISNNVIFTGALSRDHAYNLMKKSDYFLSFYEAGNIGNTLLEAIDAGATPILRSTGNTKSINQNHWVANLLPSEENEFMAYISKKENIAKSLLKTNEIDRELFISNNIFDWNMRIKKEFDIIK